MRILPTEEKDKAFDLLLKYFKVNETVLTLDFMDEENNAACSIIFDQLEEVTKEINIILGLKKREIIQTELKFE